ncbi:MAG: 23S rRNA (uracil(1939)-C(5))-methyltransferase RlmD [Lachnospiraceae bacterium]|nr:23S rRNA (uracil(1939)-C(5))-methyltransferase RlmD [Lachnospiraceae bacterium]
MKYQKNDVLKVKIEDIGFDGAGIGKADGYTIFVKDAVIGDIVSARVMKAKQNFAYAKLEEVVTPSSFRVTPRCNFHRECGGCQLQALSYEKQLEFKQNKVRNNLLRIGGFKPELVDEVLEPIVGMKQPFRYRNKAQYPVGYDKAGKLVTGFYAGRTHDIIASTDCLLGDERNKEILEASLAYMEANGITAYNEKSGAGLVRHIIIRNGFYSSEVMVCFVLNVKDIKSAKQFLNRQQDLIDAMMKIRGMVSLILNFNAEKTNVIMGETSHVLWGKETISDRLHILNPQHHFADTGHYFTYQISPLSFYQVNPRQTEKLYSLALEYAGLTGQETVWDLYCGIGTVSLFFAAGAKKVYGLEIIPEAVRDACQNARNNKIENIEFFSGKAEVILPEKHKNEGIHADIIIVDPPRKGCDSVCLETMIEIKPQRIIYISCDSATLARDLQILCNSGYQLKRARAVDQFGQTVHVETVCLLEKKLESYKHEIDS